MRRLILGGDHFPTQMLLVSAPTGIEYQQQCNGVACEQRTLEGFLAPLTTLLEGQAGLVGWAARHLDNRRTSEPISDIAIDELDDLLGRIRSFSEITADDLLGREQMLSVDRDRLDDLVEAWVPVNSALGPAILVWENSD